MYDTLNVEKECKNCDMKRTWARKMQNMEEKNMKTKLKRVLCVILTLCMMVTMVPSTVVPVEAAAPVAGDYELYADFPTNSNALLPNGSTLVVPMILKKYNGQYWEKCENYEVQIDANSYTTNEADLVNVKLEDSTTVKFTANNNGAFGECRITVEAVVNSSVVSNAEIVVNTMQTVYDVPVELIPGNVEAGDSIDLTQCFTMTKYTYDPTTKSVSSESIPVFTNSDYLVEITNYEFGWNLDGYVLTRKESYEASFSVNVKASSADSTGQVLWYAGNNYEFDRIDYSVFWQDRHLNIGNEQNTKDFYLNVKNVAEKSYDIDFTIGQGPSSNFSVLNNQSQLYTEINDDNTGKVIGIRLNRKAIADNCQGDFEIKTDVKINNQTRYSFVQSVQMISPRFNWNYNNGAIYVYDDVSAVQFDLDIRSLSDLTSYDIDFEIGTVGEQQQFVPLDESLQSKLATKVIDQNSGNVTGVILNGVEIGKLINGNNFTVVSSVKVGSEVIAKSSVSMQLRRAGAQYRYYYGDTCFLPSGGMGIDPQVECWIQNSQNPNGTRGYVDVTDVSVRIINGAADAVVVEYDGYMWSINARSQGKAEVTVTHETYDGGSTTYAFTIDVVDSIWREYFAYKESVDSAVPGGNIGVTLDMLHLKYNPTDGQYAANTPYEVEWSLMYPEHAQYVTFTYNNTEKTDVTINVAQNTPLWDIPFRYTVYELDANGNRVQDEHGNVNPIYSMAYPVRVMDRFCKIQLTGLDKDLEVGESMTLTPSLIKVYTENGTVKESALTADRVVWWDDGEMFDIVDNGDGTYKITRLSDWQIETFGVSMETVAGGEGEGASRAITFPGLEYSTWFKTLRGQNDTTWMYDTEEYTLEVDTTNLDNKRADITIDWIVVKWLDDENYEEIETGYTANGTTITLKGKELAAQGLEAFSLAGIVKSNGYMVGYSAYADVEIIKSPKVETVDPSKPVVEVTPVLKQEAMDAAVKEAVNVVDEVSAAINSEEIIVDSEGKIDKLPAALEGVVSKETVEAIIEAKEEGKTITVEVVSEVITREEAVQTAAADVTKIEAAIPGQGKVAQFLDLTVMIKAVDSAGQEENLGTLNQLKEEKMTFAIVLPKNLNPAGKNFYVLRVHDGVVDKLPATKNADGTLSFTTDRYSTYALVYEEILVEDEKDDSVDGDNTDNAENVQQSGTVSTVVSSTPATGDNSHVGMWTMLLFLTAMCMGVTLLSFQKRRK